MTTTVSGSELVEAGPTSSKWITSATNTPHGTAKDGANKERSTSNTLASYGGQTLVSTKGKFPALGSTLGQYFCLGKLGKGTFCSIHKCVNLHYFEDEARENGRKRKPHRLVAAKVEVGEFRNSGVLLGEASMLHFLDSSLPESTVPVYMGHYRGDEDVSAIVMEYLPGQDMHYIREKTTSNRRLTVEDSVYLTATIMLPLLQRMHEVGIVHRDVKPSNCVKRGLKDFCMVDFGLSKSVVVPKDSPYSDREHPWKGKDWIRPPNQSGEGHYRNERSVADFRGTSMYASVRVHQLKDYCARDDVWSLLYVFCDLVSGGLPWMSHAANRDRQACQKLKERIHGEEEGRPDETERLLMGHIYHMALFKKYKGGIDPVENSTDDDIVLPEPLPMSKDEKKVNLLRKAFEHVGKLSFNDTPDYNLIKKCLEGFLDEDGEVEENGLAAINWKSLHEATQREKNEVPVLGGIVPTWDFEDAVDTVHSGEFSEAESISASENSENNISTEDGDFGRLPLELRFRICQMEYNTLHHSKVPPHLALRDWLRVALPVLYGEWDSREFEKGGHRSSEDVYRRESYLKIIEKCLKCARKFDRFRALECFYHCDDNAPRKRRKITSTMPGPKTGSRGTDLLAVAKVSFQLRHAKKLEEKKPYAPPPRLQFGSSR
eukprot:scaffold14008_cov124-Cylindrotheca_fusiformis.AAC.2